MIRLIIGAVLGALGAYTYATSPRFQRQVEGKKKKLKELGTGFRLPDPSKVVDLPEDLEDMNLVDDLICECAENLRAQQPQILQDPEATIAVLQLCAASLFYDPEEVAWPPVAGDHPTVHQLWGILGFRARRLVVRGELEQICFTGGSHPQPPQPPPTPPGGLRPGG